MIDLGLKIGGFGAVSPAGWGVDALLAAVRAGRPLPIEEWVRTAGAPRTLVRRVPKPPVPPAFLRDPRLRRTSPIAQFAVGAALEALGPERVEAVKLGGLRLGVIFAVMNGCVNFSRRFYSEVLADPHTASPLIFPETVFNAPASHLSALLGSGDLNVTFVGDSAQFVACLDLAAQWIDAGDVDGCLVVGAEELDWLSAEAASLLDRGLAVSEGAAALYLERGEIGCVAVTPSQSISNRQSRTRAARRVRELVDPGTPVGVVLFDSMTGSARTDRPEAAAWADWTGPRISVKKILGDGLGAGTGWQCVAAAARLAKAECAAAVVSAVGTNQQAVGARFISRIH